MRHSHKRTRRLIERYFVAGLSAAGRRRLGSELDGCVECREHFVQMRDFESILYREQDGMPTAVSDRLERAIFSANRTPLSNGRKLWVAGAAVAASILLVMWLFPRTKQGTFAVPTPSTRDTLSMEIRSKSAEISENHHVGIRVFKVDARGGNVAPVTSVGREDMITFTYTSTDARYKYLTVFGTASDGATVFYYPAARTESISIHSDVVDEPLNDGFRLTNLPPGMLRITALFSDVPLATAALEERLAEDSRDWMRPVPLKLERPGAQIAEHTVWVEIDP